MEPEIDHIELQHAEEFSSGRIATADVDEASRPEAALAPVDGGFGAWSFVSQRGQRLYIKAKLTRRS
jgi:hypothetical protein